jgi:hypothetical protein
MQVYKPYFSPESIQEYINQISLRSTTEQQKLIDRSLKTPGKG